MPIEYKFRFITSGSTEYDCECEGCAAPVPLHSFKSFGKPSKQLCDLCASTPLGNAIDFPQQHDRDSVNVMRTTNYAANAVLLQLGKFKDCERVEFIEGEEE